MVPLLKPAIGTAVIILLKQIRGLSLAIVNFPMKPLVDVRKLGTKAMGPNFDFVTDLETC
jgi:hypothetical protein